MGFTNLLNIGKPSEFSLEPSTYLQVLGNSTQSVCKKVDALFTFYPFFSKLNNGSNPLDNAYIRIHLLLLLIDKTMTHVYCYL